MIGLLAGQWAVGFGLHRVVVHDEVPATLVTTAIPIKRGGLDGSEIAVVSQHDREPGVARRHIARNRDRARAIGVDEQIEFFAATSFAGSDGFVSILPDPMAYDGAVGPRIVVGERLRGLAERKGDAKQKYGQDRFHRETLVRKVTAELSVSLRVRLETSIIERHRFLEFGALVRRYDVTVVGGGASSVFFLHSYLSRNVKARSVLWVRASEGVGVAYDTPCESHLLNVPAERMGIDPADARGFHRWLTQVRGIAEVTPQDFVPRKWYGDYLRSCASQLLQSSTLEIVSSEVVSCDELSAQPPSWQITLKNGTVAQSDKVLLAVGAGSSRHIGDPWGWLMQAASQGESFESLSSVKIIGSGLTALDMVLALRDGGYRGPVEVLSRSGQWSAAHHQTTPLDDSVKRELVAALRAEHSARHYLATLRRYTQSYPWRAVLDAIRSETPMLWRSLPKAEQRRVMRHLFDLWNRHRHRAPPQALERVLRDEKVRVIRARADSDVLSRAGRIDAHGELVLDCRGLRLGDPSVYPAFVTDLVASRHLEVAGNGMGLSAADPSRLEIIGALRFGNDFECTAVPELRSRAVDIADRWLRD